MIKLSRPNISDEAIAAVVETIRSGQLTQGEQNDLFEKELAEYLNCKDVVTVSSGTSALHLSLMALDIKQGDYVIVPDFTFPATANAVLMVGAKPIIVDVKASSYNIDVDKLESTISKFKNKQSIKAIIPVHEFGAVANIIDINLIANKYGIHVIEDAACALGANLNGKKAGTFGMTGCFSFHPRKTLTTGEGGAIATNNLDISNRLRSLRNHGIIRTAKGIKFKEFSTNYRLSNFQAALGRKQLPYLDNWIEDRTKIANKYINKLKHLENKNIITLPKKQDGHSWQTFMIAVDKRFNRDDLIAKLKEFEIETNIGAQSLSTIEYLGTNNENLNGKKLFETGLALPIYETLKDNEIDKIIYTLHLLLDSNKY